MTIKWVNSDPLVMNGEPFCYGTRLTVRNLLEMRSNGLSPAEMLSQHPELKRVGIAEAFRYAAEQPRSVRRPSSRPTAPSGVPASSPRAWRRDPAPAPALGASRIAEADP